MSQVKSTRLPRVRRVRKASFQKRWNPVVLEEHSHEALKGLLPATLRLVELDADRAWLEPGMEKALFRKTRQGVSISWTNRDGIPLVLDIGTRDPRTLRGLAASFELEGQFGIAVGRLVKLVAKRLTRKAPRGPSGHATEFVAAVRSAARHLHPNVETQLRRPEKDRARWFKKLLEAISREGEGLGWVSMRPGKVDPVCLTAYAITRFADIPWSKLGLKCPVDGQAIDREHFLKTYLSRPSPSPYGSFLLARLLQRLDHLDPYNQISFHSDRIRLKAKELEDIARDVPTAIAALRRKTRAKRTS